MNAEMPMAENGPSETVHQAEDPQGDRASTSTQCTNDEGLQQTDVTLLREKLAICHDLSKYVWYDNQKRNFGLLKKIHEYSSTKGY